MSIQYEILQGSFWKIANGKQSHTHEWKCLNPEKKFIPKEIEYKNRIKKAATTRKQKRADEMNISLTEYDKMNYGQRSKLFKDMEKAGTLKSQQINNQNAKN